MPEIILTEKEEARFRSKVDVQGPWDCWEWKRSRQKGGYGRFSVGNRVIRGAHQVAFYFWHGRWAKAGLEVMHLCNNSSCCNPCHLKEGTHAENAAQMAKQGRSCKGDKHRSRTHPESVMRGDQHPARTRPGYLPVGSAHKNSKTTDDQVREMRRRFDRKEAAMSEIKRETGLGLHTVWCILHRTTWKHVTDG